MELQRNVSYTVQATVTNLSTAGGQPVAADLKTLFMAEIGGWNVMAQGYSTIVHYGPGETLIAPAPWPLVVPDGVPAGSTGEARAYVYDPNNHVIAMGSLPVSVLTPPPPNEETGIIYGRVYNPNFPFNNIPNIEVVATGPMQKSAVTNASGNYQITGLLPGLYTVQGYDNGVPCGSWRNLGNKEVVAGQAIEATFPYRL